MADERSFVIVGAGLAGAKAAEALRARGFAGGITLIGDEPFFPHERPALSKGFLQGTTDREALFVHPEQWYEQNRVTVLTGVRATAIDRAAHRMHLDDGRSIR